MVVLLMLLSTVALKIFPSDPTTVHKAIGSRVILGCHFTWEDMDHGPLEIEWTLKFDLHKVYFNSSDPSQADTSVINEGLKRSDAGTYKCQVKMVPGIEHRSQNLHLIAAPSLPICTVEGTTYIGLDVFLKVSIKWNKTRRFSTPGTVQMDRKWNL
uniref:Ig-like domain-containing protein n=1 Tax=Electrophorus electricus TaxID=8005 RepID=A0AAY5EGS5_ELEEL